MNVDIYGIIEMKIRLGLVNAPTAGRVGCDRGQQGSQQYPGGQGIADIQR
jgi:hypothetical protein